MTINFFFLPKQMDAYIEEAIFYFSLVAVVSKALTFTWQRETVLKILMTLESDGFQPDTEYGQQVLNDAKNLIKKYWKITAAISYTSHLSHIFTPLFVHIIQKVNLELPVCSYSFLPDQYRSALVYLLYLYQAAGMHCVMLFNLSIDTFFLGIMVLIIAQLDILDFNLRKVTVNTSQDSNNEDLTLRLNNLFAHFEEVSRYKFPNLTEGSICTHKALLSLGTDLEP
jgi:hypothetical protein